VNQTVVSPDLAGIDAAWNRVASMEGWVLSSLERWYADPDPNAWCARAFPLRPDGSWRANGRREAFGTTPAAALNALADVLGEARHADH